MTGISTQTLTSPLRLSVMQAQAALVQAQSEVSSGTKADLGLSLGAQTGTSLSLKSEIDRLNTYTGTNALASTRLASTSSALDSLISSAQSMSSSLITASSAGALTSSVQASATSALNSLISTLNTSANGQYIFGGIKTDAAPVAAYTDTSAAKTAVDSAFQSAFPNASTTPITGTQMQSFLDNQFSAQFSASGWQANWSGASSTAIQSTVAPSQSVTTSVSANETAFRQIAQAYTMISAFTGGNLSDDAKAAVVSTATTLVNTALASLTNVQSAVGVAQSTISSANTQISDQVDVLQNNVDDLDGVDTYALSSKVTALQTQLEASYELTSRLSSLSLVNYLTAG